MKTEKDYPDTFKTSADYGKFLKLNPELLRQRKANIAAKNKSIKHIISEIKCKTCSSVKEHPVTGYCFVCDTDNY